MLGIPSFLLASLLPAADMTAVPAAIPLETSSRHRRSPPVALHVCCRVTLKSDQQGAATPCLLLDKVKGFYVK